MSDSEDPMDNIDDVVGDDLFGDGDEDGGDLLSEVEQELSERELASDGDDNDGGPRRDSRGGSDEPTDFHEKVIIDIPLYRHRIPKSHDGSLHSLRVPDFFRLNPIEYKPDSWEPSKWDLKNAMSENPLPVVLSRRNPKTGLLQSNTNVYRWSDGSVTLAIGNEHFEIQTKALAPPRDKPYQEVQDAHYYAAAAHLTTNSLLIVGHFTEQYTVRPNKEVQDHALERLKANLAEQKDHRTDLIGLTTEDPELQKKQAEMAEKERLKLQRRRENAAARADGTASRYKGGALSIGDLEGGRRTGAGGRKRGAPGGAKQKRRRPEYDSDDELPSGARRDDNYDMDDGFLVNSDEESEEEFNDDDEEEILDDDDEEEAPRTKRRKTADDEDADAEADMDDDTPAHAADSRRRKRRVVDDDDEE